MRQVIPQIPNYIAVLLGVELDDELFVDKANLCAKVVAFPARDDIDFEFNEQLIVELYSK